MLFSLTPSAVCAGNPDAKRLYDDLLSNYNKLVRPVVNVTDALTVRIKLKLSQLIDVVRAFHFILARFHSSTFVQKCNKHELCISVNISSSHFLNSFVDAEPEKSDYDIESVGGTVVVRL